MKELKENGCLKLDSVSSEVVLLEEDLLITMTQAEGFVTEGDNNVTVVMDTRLTPELIEEGFVRELISKIQTMRKEAGFEVMDHIAVSYTADEKVTGIFNKYGEKIQTEVLANAITAAHLPDIRKNGALTVRRLRWQWKNNSVTQTKHRGGLLMRDKVFSKKEFIASVTENVKTMYRKTLKEATQQEIYQAVSLAVKDVVMDEWMATQQVIEKDDPKILYYMSMEFLMGRALGNNLINLGAYGEVKEALEEIGLDLSVIEDQEPDPALGNGGLGRLAACFMDSLATLGYAAYGCGIRYRYGMFKQQIIDGFQVEVRITG